MEKPLMTLTDGDQRLEAMDDGPALRLFCYALSYDEIMEGLTRPAIFAMEICQEHDLGDYSHDRVRRLIDRLRSAFQRCS